MSIELQKIDCNCNDCGFMVRDLDELEEAKRIAYEDNLELFRLWKVRNMQKAWNYNNAPKPPKGTEDNRFEKCSNLIKEIRRRKFSYSHNCSILYGHCEKFNKDVSFIPNSIQLDTQECFVHRKDK